MKPQMYDELVSALRNNADHYGFVGNNGLVHLLTNAADAIEKLSKPRWIPVTERLPEKYEPVLVCYRGYNTGEPMADCNAYIDDDGDWCWYDGFPASGVRVAVPITHWMPLPEPPKEKTE